jgi:hypothetical protein
MLSGRAPPRAFLPRKVERNRAEPSHAESDVAPSVIAKELATSSRAAGGRILVGKQVPPLHPLNLPLPLPLPLRPPRNSRAAFSHAARFPARWRSDSELSLIDNSLSRSPARINSPRETAESRAPRAPRSSVVVSRKSGKVEDSTNSSLQARRGPPRGGSCGASLRRGKGIQTGDAARFREISFHARPPLTSAHTDSRAGRGEGVRLIHVRAQSFQSYLRYVVNAPL